MSAASEPAPSVPAEPVKAPPRAGFVGGVRFLLALLVGGFFYFISPPQTLPFLQWGVWVPLFLLLEGRSSRQDFVMGWLAGVGLNLAGFYWIVHTITVFSNLPMPVALLALLLFALYGGLPYGMLGWLVPRVRARFGSAAIFLVPACWVGIELIFPQIFPYHQGDLQYRNLPILQVASLVGIAGVSFLIMASNLFWTELLDSFRGRVPRPVKAGLILSLLLAGLASWGARRVEHLDEQAKTSGSTLKVGMIQANYTVHELRRTKFEDVFQRYRSMSLEAVAKGAQLVVWGEGASPYAPFREWEQHLALSRELGVDMLFGAPGRTLQGDKVARFNSAYALPAGSSEYLRYDKNVLLAFGEYMPGAKLFPWLKGKIKGIGDFTAGEGTVLFPYPRLQGPPVKALTVICYEAILPDFVREEVKAQQPNLLVNITYNAWFGDTACPHQFLMSVAPRAVEHGMGVVRVANTGISAVIDPSGRIRGQTPLFQQAVAVEDVILGQSSTVFQSVGVLFSVLCTLVGGLVVLQLRRTSAPSA